MRSVSQQESWRNFESGRAGRKSSPTRSSFHKIALLQAAHRASEKASSPVGHDIPLYETTIPENEEVIKFGGNESAESGNIGGLKTVGVNP